MSKFSIATAVGPREPVRRLGELARTAETYGFHTLWLQDNPLNTKDAYVALAVAALHTERLLLAPGVSNPLIRHLSVIANAISTLDDLSEGRAIMGFGSGGPALLTPLGYPAGRIAQFREDLKRLRALLQGGEAVGEGSIRFGVRAVHRPIPIYVAAAGPRMLQVAGELADGAMISGPAQKEPLGRKIERLRNAARAAGRDPSEVRINLLLTLSYHAEPQVAINDARPLAASLAGSTRPGADGEFPPQFAEAVRLIQQQQHDYRTHLSARSPEAELVPDAMAKYVAIVGDEAECRKRLNTILELEPDEVTFRLLSGGRMQRLEKLAALIPGSKT